MNEWCIAYGGFYSLINRLTCRHVRQTGDQWRDTVQAATEIPDIYSDREFVDLLSHYQLSKKCSALWSQHEPSCESVSASAFVTQ
jgi:hypothetical protein